MKNTLILLFLSLLFNILGYGQSEGTKSLNRKCEKVRKVLEEKYGKEIISHDCDISIRFNGTTLISSVSFKSNPEWRSRVVTHFDEGFKKILQMEENVEIDFIAYQRKDKALKELGSILKSYEKLNITYSPFEVAISLYGNMNQVNNQELTEAIAYLSKKENEDLLMITTSIDKEPTLLPEFYLNIVCNDADFSVFPLLKSEETGIDRSFALVLDKKGGEINLIAEYSLFIETNSFYEKNVMDLLQRKIMTASKKDSTYRPSVGGYNYINKK